ncbi:ABC transporter ATP-binding protein [Clostridium septicum]|uniref:ABC transporter ATP-binding protein n=1 Tax=Clostridium septicum TaxID=1504 RepID=A0A9N7JM47_CLOSE|nr:ABC transporter ATP-binding protein [Clostridium septicum]AYE35233.1 heme ABC transporter ATP-binding protein [Clostridium septicum]QAS60628.1 ABC transporter ATP-binding protein [Clostridium septicum]UEC20116.1 ABC transporter ATP-binding protein [Clostridium septicum]USS01827.1 ABC transporter ATP-binding protein [Clostridium septicum]WLF70400.1 ABC transporter ATP-binding protein [Clostridium septicum]
MKKPIIEFKDFSVQYIVQEEKTLKNINLTIYEGEKVLIVGPSGSGKSTIAHCINGLIPFSYDAEISGSLKVHGKETKNMSIFELSKVVGTVLQDPDSQFIGLTVGEDIAFKLENDCVPNDKMKSIVEHISKIVDINTHINVAPHRLSGGQKQRVTLAGAIVDNVDILLFDEPLASLDPKAGKASIELIDEIQKNNNKTILIVEHRLEDVLYKDVDRIIVMNEGQIVADTNPDELLSSNILKDNGIREPLYITALKYAGCNITKEIKPSNINKINLDNYRENIINWYNYNKEVLREEEKSTILEFNNVSFGYSKNLKTLNNISFKINKGDMVSIVGKNGAGKSTISKLICGFYKEISGDILFNGKSLKNYTIKERAEVIGMVMQNPNQMISKTMIFDEVAFGLKVRGVSEDEIKERVFETLKICGLYEYRNWPISALSYGQKKRVTIASILVLNPEIIILDEPTAGQDFKRYNEIMEFLLKLNKRGITIIMITHDMHLMLEYTNRAIVIANGCKLADDTSVNILTDKTLIKAANLKETSLYELAVKLGLNNPKDFVKKFINYDRSVRS